MWRLILVACAFVALVQAKNLGHHDLVEDDWEITNDPELVLQSKRLYEASCNCTVVRSNKSFIPKPLTEEEKRERDKLPREFDWRTQMPSKCSCLRHISDQSHCGSCWAFSTTEVMSDRLCIHSQGKIDVQLSAIHMAACEEKNGCKGGALPLAFEFYRTNGIVSGGDYHSNQGCWPYPFKCAQTRQEQLETHLELCPEKDYKAPSCPTKCPNPYYRKSIKEDLYFGQEPYQLKNELEIMKDIMKNGPVSAGFDEYDDFQRHKTEVYYHPGSEHTDDGHAIKILGWGETKDGTPYWLCANSWGRGWHTAGFFKFHRGKNNCGIESSVWASMPDFERSRKP